MSYLIIVGFDRRTNEAVTQSSLTQKLILDICREDLENSCRWLRNDFGFFNASKFKEQIEEMFTLLSANIPSMSLDQDKTSWLKEYWIVDCLYGALTKCFPQLSMQEITQFQERWLDSIYSGQKPTKPLHPDLGTRGHDKIICKKCEKVTVPFKVVTIIPDLPLPKTPNYCPECYESDKTLYYTDLSGKHKNFIQTFKVHKL